MADEENEKGTETAGLSVAIGNGAIAYREAIAPTPASTVRKGSVTTHNEARSGIPGHFSVVFKVTAERSTSGVSSPIDLHWSEIVVAADDAPYRAIEAEAARRIAPALRAVAEQIEALVAEYDALASAKGE